MFDCTLDLLNPVPNKVTVTENTEEPLLAKKKNHSNSVCG